MQNKENKSFRCFKCHYYNNFYIPYYIKGKKCKKCHVFNYFNYFKKKINTHNIMKRNNNRPIKHHRREHNNFFPPQIPINPLVNINSRININDFNNNSIIEDNFNYFNNNTYDFDDDDSSFNLSIPHTFNFYQPINNIYNQNFYNNNNQNNINNISEENELDNNISKIPWLKKQEITQAIIDKYGKDNKCCICLEIINDDIHISKCNHIFHYKCIEKAINKNIMDCPICRSNLRTGEKKQVINRINNYDNNAFRNVNIINRSINYINNSLRNNEARNSLNNNRSQSTNNNRNKDDNLFIIFICIAFLVISFFWR